MKISHSLALLATAGALATLTSCSLFQKSVPTESQFPDDRHALVQEETPSYRSKLLESGDVSGYWAITEVAGKKALGEDAPYLKFENTTHRVYGSNGCNTLNADYTVNPADSTLSFSQMITTMRLCPGAELSETDINMAMADTRRYQWSRQGNEYRLTLCDAAGIPLMTLLHQDYDYLNGAWIVIKMGDKKIDNPDMKLVFDVAEGKIHGNTGCNILNGTMVTDMLETGAVTFSHLATTRMMCPDIEQETALLVNLEEVTNVQPVGKNQIQMSDSQGRVILILERTTAG